MGSAVYSRPVTASDNPASQLHDTLERFADAASDKVSVITAWSLALNVESDEVPRAVARASNLLNEVEQAVRYLHQPRQEQLVALFMPRWSRPFFPTDRPWTHPSHQLITFDSITVLGSLGDTMSILSPRGVVPTAEQDASIRESILSAIEAVRGDTDVPHSLRVVMLQRLHDVLWAMDHLEVAGPGGVRAATERLMGAVFMQAPTEAQRPLVMQVWTAARGAWLAFTGGAEAQEALGTWEAFFKALPPGP